MTAWRFSLSGALAGAASALVFAAIHQLLINNIWFALIPMMIAGALRGLSLAWTYRLLFRSPSLPTWLAYNAGFVGLLILLGLVSFLIYDPITTIPVLIAAGKPPQELFRCSD